MEENKMANETLSTKLGLGDNVVVTTTVVEKTEISVVEIVKEVKGEDLKNQENKKEAVFGGNLVDADEGRMVNLSENGDSIAMDVDELLGGDNVNEVNRLFDIGDPLEVYETREKQGIDEIVAGIFEWKDEIGENDNVENKVEQDEIEEEEEVDHDFVVGDFVWVKIKSNSWWPGQIYNPSDASDYANSMKFKGGLLVAYFGNGSFSWCLPSQLKPFIENFEDMSKQSHSKKFVNAVNKALEQVSKLVRAQLMCKSQTVDLGGVNNSGIKERVSAPKGNTIRVLMERLQPVEILSTMKDSAIKGFDMRFFEIELTVLKSFLNAFNNQKGCLFGKCREVVVGKCIEGGTGEGFGKKRRKGLLVSITSESVDENGDGSGGVEDGFMSPRERKKSKYLSPPYFSPVTGGKLSTFGSGSFKEAKTEADNAPEVDSKMLVESLKKSSGKKSSQKRRVRDSKADGKKDETMELDLAFVKQKLETMCEIVQRCEESEMSANLKGSIEAGLKDVLEKVGNMSGK